MVPHPTGRAVATSRRRTVGMPELGVADRARDHDHNGVMILRGAVLLVTVIAACLLGTGMAAAAPATAPAAARSAAVPCTTTVRACVRLSTNQAWLLHDGKVDLGPVRISHGREGFRTPPGTFRVSYKDQDHISNVFNLPMPYSVFFNGAIAFHSASVRVSSHGCVHLPAAAARTFFAELNRGDVVQVVT